MKKTAILIMLITGVSKVLGLFRDVTISYFYGASNISDAYLISLSIPGIIFTLVGSAILTTYIPIYSKIEKEHGTNISNKYTNNLVNIVMIICTIIIVCSFLFTQQIVKVFAKGFDDETLALAIQFTKITMLGLYFTGLLYVFNGFLQIKGNYIIPALTGVPLNVIVILSIFLSSKVNIMILGVGSVISIFSQLMLLIPFAVKKGYRYKFVLDLKDEHIRKMAYLAIPIIIGGSVDQVNVLIDRTLASSIEIGGISALNYANKLNVLINGLFVSSISTIVYPIMSKFAAERNVDELKKTLKEALSSISFLVIPSTVGFVVFSESIVRFLFSRGAFDDQAVYMTSNALFFYSIGMIAYGFREVLSGAFYSLQDSKIPMINATIAMVMNIVLNLVLSQFIGIGGLALATSISAIFCTVLLFVNLTKKIGSFGMRHISVSFAKILIASIVMGFIAKMFYNILLMNISANLSLILSIVLGVIVYFIIAYIMRIEEMDSIINIIKKKLRI